jgi:hypothetical protein
MDAQSLKKLVKLEAIISETEPLIGRGRYRSGQNHDSLVVDTHEQIYFWNSRSGPQPGDVYTWLMNLNGWDFRQALAEVARRAGVDLDPRRLPPPPPHPLPLHTTCPVTAPPSTWQTRGLELVALAQDTLWSAAGQPGLVELRRRGLTDETNRRAGLGWNPHDRWDDPARWGFTGGRKIWLPRGLIIPWFIGDELWRIRVRRPDVDVSSGGARYISPRLYPEGERVGDHEALYNADALRPGHPAVLLEGELDCLSVAQAAGDPVVAVATGSVSGGRRPRWIARLARAAPVLVAYDADEAGDRQARYWLQVLPEARRWRPFWADANQMAQDGVDLRAWVSAGLP